MSTTPSIQAQRPVIDLTDKQQREILAECREKVIEKESDLYLLDGKLCRVIAGKESRIDLLGEVDLDRLIHDRADPVTGGDGMTKPATISPRTIRLLLSDPDIHLPTLAGLARTPFMRPDGSVCLAPGFDQTTGLLYVPDPALSLPSISDQPDHGEVLAARSLLEEAISDFCFDTEASRANALGLLLTLVMRPMMEGHVPAAVVTANKPGTGKGLLVDTLSLIAHGSTASASALPEGDEEMRKRLTSLLVQGQTVIVFDNVKKVVESSSLESFLTARRWTDRLLGSTKAVSLPQRSIVIINGNNIDFATDMARRCYLIRLEAKESRPFERTGFIHDPLLPWISQERGRLLAAALTLACAWCAAGRPEAEVKTIGSFEEWSRMVAGVLEFAGISGFLSNREQLLTTSDPEETEWEAFLLSLASQFCGEFTSSQVADVRYKLESVIPESLIRPLGNRNSFADSLGRAFRARRGTPYGKSGVKIEMLPTEAHGGRKRWRVVNAPDLVQCGANASVVESDPTVAALSA